MAIEKTFLALNAKDGWHTFRSRSFHRSFLCVHSLYDRLVPVQKTVHGVHSVSERGEIQIHSSLTSFLGRGKLPFMKKAVSVCLMAALLFLVSCNSSTPEVSSSAAAPVPVFLSGISAQSRSAATDVKSQDNLFRMYKYTIGGFALVGFDGTTSSIEIPDVDVLGTSVDFTWTKKDGVFTYNGTGSDMAIVITYDTNAGLIDLIQVSKGSAYNNDYFIVFKADDIKYDNAGKTIDGGYTAYLSIKLAETQYYPFSIGYGYAHSDENATGVLTTEILNLGDAQSSLKLDDLQADIETGNKLITMMERRWSDFSEEEQKKMTQVDLKVLYHKDDSFTQYPPEDDSVTIGSSEEIINYIKESVSDKWILDSAGLPVPAGNENAN